MKQHANLYHSLIAQILLISLFLQSCNTFSASVVPKGGQPIAATQRLTNRVGEDSISLLRLVAHGGHLVNLYEAAGELRADIEENLAGNFQKKHQHVPVYIDDDFGDNFDLVQIGKLNPKRQQQLVTVQLPQGGQQGYVYIGKLGLLGGMKRTVTKKGDEEEERDREKQKEKEGEKKQTEEESIEELLECAKNGNREAQFKLGEIAYEAWQIQHQEVAFQDARRWLSKAADQGHEVAIALLDQISSFSLPGREKDQRKERDKEKEQIKDNNQLLTLSSKKIARSKPKEKKKKTKVKEDSQQQELKTRILDQLFQPAYHQQIKLALYLQLLSPALSEEQRARLNELTQLITAPEKKLRLGGNLLEIRESFRVNPTPEHQLFEPLRKHFPKLASYQREFAGTPIELLLKELIEKNQAFVARLVAQFQKPEGPTSPLKLFEAKPILQGEGFEAYEVESEKAYQLACYNPHEYEYVRGNSSGLSIGSIQGGVYFKVDDGRGLLKPAREHAVYTFYQRLGLEKLIAPTHLVVMNGLAVLPADIGDSPERRELQRKKQELNTPSTQEVFNHYPELEQRIRFSQHAYSLRIQGSLVVAGKTLEKFLEEAEKSADAEVVMNQLEPTSFSSHILASLLLLPTDYKSDNLMVDGQNRIIGIDNDACLEAQELRELGDGKAHGVSIKNILYLLPLMQAPVARDIRTKFINHHPAVLLLDWLLALKDKQADYDKLLDASLIAQENVDQVKRNAEESLGLPLLFVPGWITGMYERFIKLQQLLKDDPQIKQQALFQAIHPYASRYYQGLKKLYPQPLDQMAFVYDKMGNLNTELSNDLESLVAEYPETGDSELLKGIAEADYQEKEVSLSMDQAIQELVANVSLKAYTPEQQLGWIERVVAANTWPSQLHPSWHEPALLIRMVQAGASPTVIQALVEKAGAQVDSKNEVAETVLHATIRSGRENACKQLSMLVQLGANLETQNKQGVTPLDLAAEQKDIPLFKHLVMLGAGKKAIAATINRFYQSLSEAEKQQLIPYIAKLTQINPKVGWKISLNEIFPYQGKSKVILSTVTEGDRVITETVWNSLFEKDGSPKKVNAYGVRPVSFVEKNGQRIYVKFFPQLPGTELAVIRLAENLLGYCAPYCELASINGTPVLLSQGVPGETLYDVLQKDPDRLKQLDPESVSKALILAMLINPGDGNLGNYIVSPFTNPAGQLKYRLISIDNDQAFMPAVAKSIKTGIFSSTLSLQVKTILYCLDAMKDPVSQKLIQQIQEKDLMELLTNWLSSLKIHHEAAKNHFDSGLLKKYQEDKASVIGVSFAPGMIKQLFTKLMRLQVALNKRTLPTHVELLSSLEPVVAHRYRSVLTDSQLSAIEKFKKAEHITEKQELASSSNALPQLLVSREISGIRELQAALWSGKFGPDQALQELKLVQAQHTNLDQIFKDLGTSKIQDIKELPASLLEKWLQEADLAKLSSPQQRVLLEAIQDQVLTYVFLKNSSVMTSSWLLPFKLEQVKKLDLSGCKNLGSLSSGILGNYPVMMPVLTHLKLDESGVSAILLEAAQLKKLMARNCTQLKILELSAPVLSKLVLGGSAILGNPIYLYEQGLKHDNKQARKLAFQYYKQAADQGHALAQNQLGWMYEHGRVVDQDVSKATVYYRKAAKQGHIGAQWNLGSMYLEGRGIDKDERKAQKWIKRANEEVLKWLQGTKILEKTNTSGALDLDAYYGSLSIEEEVLKWLQGTKILEKTNTSGALDLDAHYGSLSIEQVVILSQHPCFKQKSLKFSEISFSDISKLVGALANICVSVLLFKPGSNTSGTLDRGAHYGSLSIEQVVILFQHPCFKQKSLKFSEISFSGISKLAEVLANTQIHALDLRSNNIGASGVQELAKALANTQIHALDLRSNNIGTSGAQDLAKALPSSQIHTLDLSYNNIGASGAQDLAKALPSSQIHTLDLSYNNIGASGAQDLAKALATTQLYILDLRDNNIGTEMASKLKAQFPKIKFYF